MTAVDGDSAGEDPPELSLPIILGIAAISTVYHCCSILSDYFPLTSICLVVWTVDELKDLVSVPHSNISFA